MAAAIGLLAGSMAPSGAADYLLTYSGLTGGAPVYAIDASSAPSPFVSEDNYTITARGDGSGNYLDTSVSLYGLYLGGGPAAENLGDLDVTAYGGTAIGDAFGLANGIYANGGEPIANSGGITVSASGGASLMLSYGRAYGIYADSGGSTVNSGDITVSGSGGISGDFFAMGNAYGIYADDGGAIANSGDISASAAGGTTTSGFADGFAFGIFSRGGATINRGDISVSAVGGTSTSGEAYGTSCGIFADRGGTIINSGDISVSATGGTSISGWAYGEAHGLDSDDGTIVNSGDITVSATGGTSISGWAYGRAHGLNSDDGTIVNSGDITVSATGGTTLSGYSPAFAYGIVSGGRAIVNSGDITVSATGGTANGAINDAFAYGIITGTSAGIFTGTTDLTNTGVIRALAATEAYEVLVVCNTTLIDVYNLNLDGDPSAGSIYIYPGAGLDLNGAALTLTMVGDDFRWNTPYRIFDGAGTVSGAFGEVAALNPNVAVTYYDAGAGTLYDTVSLAYRPAGSPFLEGAVLLGQSLAMTGGMVDRRLIGDGLQTPRVAAHAGRRTLYADAGTTASDASPGGTEPDRAFFLTPYRANFDKDAAPVGYDADAIGFVGGYDHRGPSATTGFHLGYGRTKVDFTGTGFSDSGEDQDLLTAGVHALGRRSDWTWRTRLTAFYAWHDYQGLTGAGLREEETADYDSHGATATLVGGYLFRMGGHRLLPEAGIDYLWLSRDGFTTEAESRAWEVRSSSLDEHQLAGTASLRWLADFPVGSATLTPSLAAGVRYLFTGGDIDARQSVAGGAPVMVSAEQDELAGTLAASLAILEDDISLELAYAGEYGDETQMHSASLRLSYRF